MAHPTVGDIFPSLSGDTVKHGRLSLPDALPAGHYGVVFTYRAHW